MKHLLSLLFVISVALGGTYAYACGGMTTIDPPSLTLEDPVDPPPIDSNPDEWGEGECIL